MHPRLLNCALKNQETPILYNYAIDERYELDQESFEFITYFTGRNTLETIIKETGADPEESQTLLTFLKGENCLEDLFNPCAPIKFPIEPAHSPSLRYLQMHITDRCNLNCRHCYLGEKDQKDLSIALIRKALDEFSPNGMKLLITGGEALIHPHVWEVLDIASTYPIRLELLSNGLLLSEDVCKKLQGLIHSVQISLDGLKKGHEALRGKGTFEKTIKGVRNASKYLDVSIATMIHSHNLEEFPDLERVISQLHPREWILDIPSPAGNATDDLIPPLDEAAEIFRKYGYGTGVHEGDQDYSCGSHICSIDVQGGISKCGFFTDPVGRIRDEPLKDLWKKVVLRYTPKTGFLSCRSCRVVEECRGGCRYRAQAQGDLYGRDPFMCSLFGEKA